MLVGRNHAGRGIHALVACTVFGGGGGESLSRAVRRALEVSEVWVSPWGMEWRDLAHKPTGSSWHLVAEGKT